MNYIEETEKDCGGCPIAAGSTRRDFLRDAALGIAGIVASLGIARSAAALPVSMIEALARTKKGISYPIPTTDGV